MKRLSDRLDRLSKVVDVRLRLTSFEISPDDIDQTEHDMKMLETGYKLVRRESGFDHWREPTQ